MIKIEDGASSLAKVDAGGISKQAKPLSIGELELALLARWPQEDAFDWDNTGLLVGDPAQTVTGVAVALDPTGDSIEAAAKMGANVLLTHHPVFIEPPSLEELERRLRGRGTEDEATIRRRLEAAELELSRKMEYDIRLVNDNLDEAARELVAYVDEQAELTKD